MKRTIFFVAVTISLMAGSTGCLNSGVFQSANVTDVKLSEANYEIIATDVTGSSTAGYIFGVSFLNGGQAATMAIARISGTGLLYQGALEELWKNFEKDHGPREAKKVALVNVHFDTDILNLLVYTKVTLFLRADVVEFKTN